MTTNDKSKTEETAAHPNKQYLGDGAYIQQGCFHGEIVLTTENGISVQNRVVLGPTELQEMYRYIRHTLGVWRPEA